MSRTEPDNPYASPPLLNQALLNQESGPAESIKLGAEQIALIKGIAYWAHLVAVSFAFACVVSAVLMSPYLFDGSNTSPDSRQFGKWVCALAVIWAPSSIWLFRFCRCANEFVREPTIAQLTIAVRAMAVYWRTALLLCLTTVVYALVVIYKFNSFR